MFALIREPKCIGCTKCIDACPVDAIIGSHKQMHTVITDACVGCKLCLPPCPVDCIEMQSPAIRESSAEIKEKVKHARARYYAKRERLAQRKAEQLLEEHSIAERKAYIQSALARVRAKQS